MALFEVKEAIQKETLKQAVKEAIREELFYSRYNVIEVDLTQPHDNKEYDLGIFAGIAKRILILRADDTAYIKLNSRHADSIEAVPGLDIDRVSVRKIYVKNAASTVANAKLVIVVFY